VRTGYLVDTDWIIDHLSGVTAVTTRLTELGPAGLAVSIISLAELYEGNRRHFEAVEGLSIVSI